ncbi:hypothetical protein BJ741DRAFT_695572 [Chytriomyces cf. hyalinus JEL632]|nr:hypothetical protein BJ741DRAFT_695572 [Chytriomyces cf. hyalinus JEL632]
MENASLVGCILDFLEVGIRTILHERQVYPAGVWDLALFQGEACDFDSLTHAFRQPSLLARKSTRSQCFDRGIRCFNGYIKDFLMAVRPDLMQGSLSKVLVVILDAGSNSVEKFVFRVRDVYDKSEMRFHGFFRMQQRTSESQSKYFQKGLVFDRCIIEANPPGLRLHIQFAVLIGGKGSQVVEFCPAVDWGSVIR